MKPAFVVLAVFGLVFGGLTPSAQACDLAPALAQVEAIVDVEGLRAFLDDSFQNDPDGQRVFAYLTSEEFHTILLTIYDYQQVKDLLNWVQDSNVDIYGFINDIMGDLGFPTISPESAVKHPRQLRQLPKTLQSWFEQLEAFIPLQDLLNLAIQLLATDECVGELFTRLSAPEINEVVQAVRALPEVQELVATLESEGIDVEGLWNQLCPILNWCE